MASFEPAVQSTLQHEGGFFHNLKTGEIVNHGITLKFVRDSGFRPAADEQYIRDLSEPDASDIYRKYFWDRYHIDQIDDQELANKVFDLTVNMGPAALKVLQEAVRDLGGRGAIDGILGPDSLRQINGLDARRLLAQYRERARQRYGRIAESSLLASNLAGWLRRLKA